MNTPGVITIKLEGVTFEQTERCRLMIHKLFELGFFNVKNGSFTVHFDHEGTMGSTEKTYKWRNDKPMPDKSLNNYTIEMDPVNKSSIVRKVGI